MEFAVIDFETTGLWFNTDRVVEVGVTRVTDNGDVVAEFCSLVNPGRDIGPTWLHGVTAGAALQAPTFRELAPELLEILDGAVIAAHNAWFDMRFLRAELERAGIDAQVFGLCTLELAYAIERNAPRRLVDCCDYHGVECGTPHQALDDSRMAAGLLISLWRRWRYPSLPEPFVNPLAPPMRTVRVQRDTVVDPREREGHYLAQLTDRLPAFNPPGGLHPAAAAEYLNLLDRAVEDRRLSTDESMILAEFAAQSGLTASDVESLHSSYLADLYRIALADGIVTDAEQADLSAVSALLNVPLPDPDVLSEAPARSQQDLPTGTTVCFTGEMSVQRENCARRAEEAGLVVLPGVSKKLKVLVVADPDTQSGKAAKARSYGTRIVSEAAFWQLIDGV